MLKIHQVDAFSDNYIWIISDGSSAWAVDPGDANSCHSISKRIYTQT